MAQIAELLVNGEKHTKKWYDPDMEHAPAFPSSWWEAFLWLRWSLAPQNIRSFYHVVHLAWEGDLPAIIHSPSRQSPHWHILSRCRLALYPIHATPSQKRQKTYLVFGGGVALALPTYTLGQMLISVMPTACGCTTTCLWSLDSETRKSKT